MDMIYDVKERREGSVFPNEVSVVGLVRVGSKYCVFDRETDKVYIEKPTGNEALQELERSFYSVRKIGKLYV